MYALRPGTAAEAGLDARRLDLIRQRAAEWVASGKHQCIVLLLARRGVICLHEAWGKLRPEADSPPVRPDSIFWMASNTKPMTAAAIMMLAEDGLLTINRRVVDYIPELSGAGTEHLTLRHLLTYTSTWNDEQSNAHIQANLANQPRGHFDERFLSAGFDMPLSKVPGTEMDYCNYNYTLLGEIVSRVSGMPFAEFLGKRIFEPLDMHDTYFRARPANEHRMVRLDPAHPPNEGQVIDGAWLRYVDDSYNGAWGLKSPPLDYAKFVQMLMNGGSYGGKRLLHVRSVAEMTRNQIPGIGTNWTGQWCPEGSHGLGVRVLSNERWTRFDGSLTQPGLYMHGGSGGTFWWADPHHDLLGMYCSICLEYDYARKEPYVNSDLLQDMTAAAVVDNAVGAGPENPT